MQIYRSVRYDDWQNAFPVTPERRDGRARAPPNAYGAVTMADGERLLRAGYEAAVRM